MPATVNKNGQKRGLVLSVLSVVLGALTFILTAFSAFYGSILGVLSLVIGIVAIVKEKRYALSITGVALTALGLILTAGVVLDVLLYSL